MTASKRNKVSMGLRLPPDLHERLTRAADERMVSANFLATRAITEFLDRLIPPDEMRWTRDE